MAMVTTASPRFSLWSLFNIQFHFKLNARWEQQQWPFAKEWWKCSSCSVPQNHRSHNTHAFKYAQASGTHICPVNNIMNTHSIDISNGKFNSREIHRPSKLCLRRRLQSQDGSIAHCLYCGVDMLASGRLFKRTEIVRSGERFPTNNVGFAAGPRHRRR